MAIELSKQPPPEGGSLQEYWSHIGRKTQKIFCTMLTGRSIDSIAINRYLEVDAIFTGI